MSEKHSEKGIRKFKQFSRKPNRHNHTQPTIIGVSKNDIFPTFCMENVNVFGRILDFCHWQSVCRSRSPIPDPWSLILDPEFPGNQNRLVTKRKGYQVLENKHGRCFGEGKIENMALQADISAEFQGNMTFLRPGNINISGKRRFKNAMDIHPKEMSTTVS